MENPNPEGMGSGNNNPNRNSISSESEGKGGQRFCIARGLENAADPNDDDSFIVDIERFSSPKPQSHTHHLSDKDANPNSRVTLQRSLSRKGSSAQKKSNNNDTTNNNLVPAATSPRDASLHSPSTPEKSSMVVTVGSTDHAVVTTTAQLHNAITINVTGNAGGGAGCATASESKSGGRRNNFKRSSYLSWITVDPRRILFLSATISSMGTMVLIYLTLSINKLTGEDDGLN